MSRMSGRPCVWVSGPSTRESLVELNAGGLTIGRVECDFPIEDPRIRCRRHLRVAPVVHARETRAGRAVKRRGAERVET